MMPAKAGGVYIPPFKLKQMILDLKNSEENTSEHQKYHWEQLRKSINGIVNKINVANISSVAIELF